jgi:hypothetical protein
MGRIGGAVSLRLFVRRLPPLSVSGVCAFFHFTGYGDPRPAYLLHVLQRQIAESRSIGFREGLLVLFGRIPMPSVVGMHVRARYTAAVTYDVRYLKSALAIAASFACAE